MVSAAPPPLILCALAHEAALLARVAPRLPRAVVIGPGSASGEALRARATPGRRLVLVGTAGGLRAPFVAGTAALVTQVADEDGNVWRCATPGRGLPVASLVTVAQPIATPEAKRLLALGGDFDLVDCESAHVVAEAERLGCPWLVVRGVSDGPDDCLPGDAAEWIDARGRTRPGRVASSLFRRPALLGTIARLARDSRGAIAAAAPLVERAIAAWGAEAEGAA